MALPRHCHRDACGSKYDPFINGKLQSFTVKLTTRRNNGLVGFIDWIIAQVNKHGRVIRMVQFGRTSVLLADPGMLKKMLQTDVETWGRGGIIGRLFADIGTILF